MHKLNIDIESFLRSSWQRQFQYMKNALPDFCSPISPGELQLLATEEYIEARMLHCFTNEPWMLNAGPIAIEDCASQKGEPCSLLVQAVDQWNPEVQQLLKLFDFLPSWRLDDIMISLSTNGAGVGPHYDQYDVFLIQAQGTRNWKLGGIYDDDAPQTTNAGLKQLSNMDVIEEFSLVPGDILYLPPGTGHDGVATSDDCITISIGFRAPSHAEALTDFASFAADLTKDSQRFSDANRPTMQNPREISDWDIQNIQSILLEYAENKSLVKQWFGSLMTEQKYPELMPENLNYSKSDWLQGLSDADIVILDPASRISFDDEFIYIDARIYSRGLMTTTQGELFTDNDRFEPAAFTALFGHSDGLDQLLLECLNLGTFYLE